MYTSDTEANRDLLHTTPRLLLFSAVSLPDQERQSFLIVPATFLPSADTFQIHNALLSLGISAFAYCGCVTLYTNVT